MNESEHEARIPVQQVEPTYSRQDDVGSSKMQVTDKLYKLFLANMYMSMMETLIDTLTPLFPGWSRNGILRSILDCHNIYQCKHHQKGGAMYQWCGTDTHFSDYRHLVMKCVFELHNVKILPRVRLASHEMPRDRYGFQRSIMIHLRNYKMYVTPVTCIAPMHMSPFKMIADMQTVLRMKHQNQQKHQKQQKHQNQQKHQKQQWRQKYNNQQRTLRY